MQRRTPRESIASTAHDALGSAPVAAVRMFRTDFRCFPLRPGGQDRARSVLLATVNGPRTQLPPNV